MESLPPASTVEVIESVPSVCLLLLNSPSDLLQPSGQMYEGTLSVCLSLCLSDCYPSWQEDFMAKEVWITGSGRSINNLSKSRQIGKILTSFHSHINKIG